MKNELVKLLSKALDLSEIGEYEEALQCYDKVLKEDPKKCYSISRQRCDISKSQQT